MKHFAFYSEENENIYLSGYMDGKIFTTKDPIQAFDLRAYSAAHMVASMAKDLDPDKSHKWAVHSTVK